MNKGFGAPDGFFFWREFRSVIHFVAEVNSGFHTQLTAESGNSILWI